MDGGHDRRRKDRQVIYWPPLYRPKGKSRLRLHRHCHVGGASQRRASVSNQELPELLAEGRATSIAGLSQNATTQMPDRVRFATQAIADKVEDQLLIR